MVDYPTIRKCLRIALLHEKCDSLVPNPDRVFISEKLSSSDEDRVAEIVKKELKSKSFDDRVLKLTKNILTQLFKSLYNRKSMWRDSLSTMSESTVQERDDINKLPLTGAQKRYARGSGLGFLKTKQKQHMAIIADLVDKGRPTAGFANLDDGRSVSGGKLGGTSKRSK